MFRCKFMQTFKRNKLYNKGLEIIGAYVLLHLLVIYFFLK